MNHYLKQLLNSEKGGPKIKRIQRVLKISMKNCVITTKICFLSIFGLIFLV